MNIRISHSRKLIARSARRYRLLSTLLLVFLTLPSLSSSEGEDEKKKPTRNSRTSLHPSLRLNGKTTTAAFADASGSSERWTLRIFVGDRPAALGTILSADGFIGTKLSEITGSDVQAEWKGKKFKSYKVGVDRENDFVVFKINGAEDLSPIDWAPSNQLNQGDWIASPDRRNRDLVVGVIAAKSRGIERMGGVLGVQLDRVADRNGGVKINSVSDLGAAKKAGIRAGDAIIAIGGQKTSDRLTLQKLISKHDAGETVSVQIRRRDKTLEYEVTLGHRAAVFPDFQSRNQLMSGETSLRNAGFKNVLHHDTPLEPGAMGGPLLSLEGKALGINIARANRVSTYALGSELVKEISNQIIQSADPAIWLNPDFNLASGSQPEKGTTSPGLVKKEGFKSMEY